MRTKDFRIFCLQSEPENVSVIIVQTSNSTKNSAKSMKKVGHALRRRGEVIFCLLFFLPQLSTFHPVFSRKVREKVHPIDRMMDILSRELSDKEKIKILPVVEYLKSHEKN